MTVAGPAPRARVRPHLRARDGIGAAVAAGLAGWGLAGAGTVLAVTGGAGAALAVLLAAVDLRTHRLPDRLVAALAAVLAAGLLLAGATAEGWPALGRAVLAAGASGTGYLTLALLRTGGLGLGDVKLGAVLGAWLGWFGWPAVLAGALAAFVLGGAFTTVLLLTGRAGRSSPVAFGPWLLLGAAAGTALAVTGAL